jgi:hypothetical protein
MIATENNTTIARPIRSTGFTMDVLQFGFAGPVASVVLG